ncbi:outer membrane receptor protein involved in Fe transport [Anseongella ginsenosidimutans]|uniref:Outer membrane receptor protein involved in Fe transport n=1 Tax=Anseongella ginsenosidimutans TaxID=496056 RepID=A0A4R3KT51_9SPHI|nr:outer membrane beta-barrel family protein [Anseongella ginsenosidimutans]QEC53155.1 TonB-dependent receptor [Anseongella ginsenosidimutans]TCS87779.1 outer membrane receptor protein involved in Fe transport [Anseongella ginsenosidimutans]
MFRILTYSFLLAGSLLCLPGRSHAQQSNPQEAGTITGTVRDADGKGVDFASVTLLSLPDSTFVGGAQTEAGGKFSLGNIRPGRYTVNVSFVGYTEKGVGNVRVQAGETTELGVISIRLDSETLDEVVVESEAMDIQYDLDKTIFTVSDNIKSMSTNASDVLEQIPMVELDQEGVPSVMGQGVSVLIDGKPSRIYGDNIETVLKLIPSGLIEKIEVVTSPSARYSTEEGGIVLNIITKSEYLSGVSGIANLSVTSNNTYSPSVNVNIARRKFSFNNSIAFEYDRDLSSSNLFRENFPAGNVFFTDQTRDGTDEDQDFSYNGNLYYNITSKSRIGAFFGLGHDTENEDETLITRFLDEGQALDSAYTRIIDNRENSWNYRAGIDFDKTFSSEDHILNLEAYYSTRSDDDNMHFDQNSEWESMESLQNQVSTSDDVGFTVEGDYVQPFGEKSRLEAGFRADWETDENVFRAEYFDESAGEFLVNDALSNDFTSLESDYSLYGMYRTELNRFSLQGGLRLEKSVLETTQHLLDQYYKTDFLNLVPTLNMSYRLQNNDNVTFSYSRRVRTPRWHELNPFVDYSDPENIESGNPELKPEFINSFEASYNKFVKQFNLYASVFYRHSNDPIQRIRTVDTAGISYTNFDNVGSERYYGLETGMGADILPEWNFRVSVGVRKNEVFGFDEDNQTTAFTSNLSTFFPLPFDFKGYVFAFYQGPRSIAQGRMKGNFITNIGVRKSFLNDRADFSIRFSDVFNNRQWSMDLQNNFYNQTSTYQRQSRYLTFGFSYTFGRLQEGRERGERNGGNDGGMGGGGEGEEFEMD